MKCKTLNFRKQLLQQISGDKHAIRMEILKIQQRNVLGNDSQILSEIFANSV